LPDRADSNAPRSRLACMPLTLEELKEIQAETQADDVPIDFDQLSLLTREEAVKYFESGGESGGERAGEAGAAAGPPDFSGTWTCTKVNDSWNDFLYEMGVGLLKRKMMQGAGYGVGSQKQTITLEGDVMHVETVGPAWTMRNAHQLSGKEYDTDVLGETAKTTASYTADCISLKSAGAKAGTVISKRYFEGELMAVDMCLESKPELVAKRYLQRLT